MAFESLQALVGTAVIDPDFRKALVNGSRRCIISSFDLPHEEVDVVREIQADSLERFARLLDQWICQAQGKCDPPASALRMPTTKRLA